jgi:hypothetical protein
MNVVNPFKSIQVILVGAFFDSKTFKPTFTITDFVEKLLFLATFKFGILIEIFRHSYAAVNVRGFLTSSNKKRLI